MNRKNILVVFVLFLAAFCISTMSCKDKPKTYTVWTCKSDHAKYKAIYPTFEDLEDNQAIRVINISNSDLNNTLAQLSDKTGHTWKMQEIIAWLISVDFVETQATEVGNWLVAGDGHRAIITRTGSDIYYIYK